MDMRPFLNYVGLETILLLLRLEVASYSYSTVRYRSGPERSERSRVFFFFMLNNSLKSMSTSFVFVSQEIRKQKLHKKCNSVNKSHAFRNFQICASAQWTYVLLIFFTLTQVFHCFLTSSSVNFS